ncbi:MAG: serine acetyltransferase [Muribaculaceae bacterium]|nr:serine acetyltransferase [Muribaculaceae bacterium]
MVVLKNKLKGLLALPLATVYWLLMPPHTRQLVTADLRQWAKWLNVGCNLWGFSFLLGSKPEFRTLFYKRARFLKLLSCWWLRGKNTLEITTNDVGGGLIIQHGFSTIISAERIGKNCKIYQQVTIGFDHDLKAPVIGDNVEVCCGAKVIGGITVGDNVLIGANAAVVKDVPSNSVVAGVPARIIKHLDHMRDLTE